MRFGLPRSARAMAAMLLLAILLPAFPAQGVSAAAFAVTNTSDSGPGSLRDAITQANGNPGATITFAVSGTITLASALPHIAANTTLDGATAPGYAGTPVVEIDGNGTVTVITTNPGTDVRLRGVTIQHGAGATGGGILNNGTLTIDTSGVVNNASTGSGGGVYNGGTLTIIASTIGHNSAASGGGIFSAGTLTLTASTVETNTATGLGGGLLITSNHTQTISNSTIAGNSGTAGGGIDNQGKLALINSTVAGNRATAVEGGGVKAEAQGLSVTSTNTIIAGNTRSGPDDVSGTFISSGHNLIGDIDGSIGFGGAGSADLTGTAAIPFDPGLGPLASNGGPTQTLTVQSRSPALGAGDPAICTAAPIGGIDQRGFPRAPSCGIGAFEVQRIVSSVTVTPLSSSVVIGGTKQFTATATYADNSMQDVTTSATWSSDPAIATVVNGFMNANPGQATGIAAGSTTITAQFGTKSDHTMLTVANPVPAITSLAPSPAITTSGASTLTVNGTGFVSTSQVSFDSTALTTSFVSPTQLVGTIPAGLLATPGSASITVVNPTPGGGTSNAQPLAFTAGTAATFVLSGFSGPIVAGVGHTVTITAKDSLGNVATGYNGPVFFMSSDFAATLPTGITFTNGVGSGPITLKTAGTQYFVVRDLGVRPFGATQSGIVVTPAAPASITANPGTTPQSATIGTAFSAPLAVTVNDAFGNAVSGASVAFTAPASGASGAFTGSATVTTNAIGIATAPAFTANATAGAYRVMASVGGVATPATFATTNLPGPPGSIVATGGTPQRVAVGGAFAPLTAVVKDGSGNLVAAGVSVTFTAPASGTGGTFVGGGTTSTALTVAGGSATSPVFRAGSIAGSYTVVASAPGAAAPAIFSLTNTAGPPASIAPAAGASQNVPINTAFPTALAARVIDATGNAISGASVTFTAPTSGASGAFAGGVSTATTNAAGVATAPTFTANGTVGNYTVAANVGGVSATASFGLANTPGPVASFALATPPGASKTSGVRAAVVLAIQSGNPLTISVTALDASGNTATGYAGTVRFTATDPHALLPANYTFGPGDAGEHTFTLTLKAAGAQTVTVNDAGGAASGTASITVSAVPTSPPVVPPTTTTPATPTTTAPTKPAQPPEQGLAEIVPFAPVAALPVAVPAPASIALPFVALPSFTDTPQCRYFAETQHALCSGFFGYWQQHGGTALFGMPISEEFQERGADGTARTVQYLERARFEYHPEFKGTIYEVELGLLARELAAARPGDDPFAPISATNEPTGARFYAETGHALADPFAPYWDANGGLPLFGFPISESFQERNADTGQTYFVQYFERYRLEYHPDATTVELGRLGVQDAQMRGYLPH